MPYQLKPFAYPSQISHIFQKQTSRTNRLVGSGQWKYGLGRSRFIIPL